MSPAIDILSVAAIRVHAAHVALHCTMVANYSAAAEEAAARARIALTAASADLHQVHLLIQELQLLENGIPFPHPRRIVW